MSIAPIIKHVDVAVPPQRAFDLFTGSMGRWWKKGRTIGSTPHVDIVIEPFSGGRWFERGEDGEEVQWGKVLAWEPPGRVLLGWQLNAAFRPDPDLLTEVELRFEQAPGGTRVTLEHRNLERFGPSAAELAGKFAGGWQTHIRDFADYADAHAGAGD